MAAEFSKRRFIKFHLFVDENAYKQSDDDVIISNFYYFTQKQIQCNQEFRILFDTRATIPNQTINSTRIQHGQMIGYHNHDYYEINYVFKDKVYEYINDDLVVLQAGDMLLMHPDIFHSLYPNPNSSAINILIHKDYAQVLSEKLHKVHKDNSFSFVVNKKAYVVLHSQSDVLTNTLNAIADFPYPHLAKNNLANLYLESLFYQMITNLLMEEADGNVSIAVNGISKHSKRIEEILEYINTNYATIDANTICNRFHYSRMQLYRLLKNTVGLSFIDYISELRYRHSSKLLISSDLSIKEIAAYVGLDENYFYRFFKKYSGMSPGDYRDTKLQS